MDKRCHFAWRPALMRALAQALPDEHRTHPDALVLAQADSMSLAAYEAAMAPLVEGLPLGLAEQVGLWLSLWAEVDARGAALLSLLQGHGPHRGPQRPTLGLVDALTTGLGADVSNVGPAPLGALLQGAALASGLLYTPDPQAPAHARVLQLHPAVLNVLSTGGLLPSAGLPLGRLALHALAPTAWLLPVAWREAARRLAKQVAAASEPVGVIVLRSPERDEALALASLVAHHLGRRALDLHGLDDTPPTQPAVWQALAAREAVAPVLWATGALAVWSAPLTPGQATEAPVLAHAPGPLLVLAPPDAAVAHRHGLLEFDLTRPEPADRLAVWLHAIGAHDLTDHERRCVVQSRCGISVLARAAREAARGRPAHEAIELAVRASARGLAAWAQVSHDRVPADAWVGSPALHHELGLLLARCMAREGAAAPLGPLLAGRLNAGVKALFIGASGTGKTLAAQWLADRLARPLVRVDLASVVSKYIGETEKNLAQLLSRAEHLDAVLLFDEADSLFGARTDVKQANDRYANMQTNYLLQRLETFHGLAVLTSNSKARFDDAFLRRLDSVIDFPRPDVAERRALWALHLGDVPGLDAPLMNQIAALADLPGGHIRNAALTSAVLARMRRDDDPTRPDVPLALQPGDLREALALEYRKLGQRPPERLCPPTADPTAAAPGQG